MTRSVALAVTAYTLVYALACTFIASRLNDLAPAAYMDEVFHVPQTQAYCQGRFGHWDAKITTFPGLYLTALGYLRLLAAGWPGAAAGSILDVTAPAASSPSRLSHALDHVCTTEILRSLNILYGALCVPLFFLLLKKLHPEWRRAGALLGVTVQLSLFPLFFFFHFLFYTDGASVFWTLAAYLAHLSKWRFTSSALGFVAILMRQTNVVWIGFMLLTEIMDAWTANDPQCFGEQRNTKAAAATSSTRANDGEKEDKIALTRALYHPTSWSSFPRTLVQFVFSCLRSLPSLVLQHFGLLLLCVSFVIFVVWNDYSIVVGDRTNHKLSLHFPQLLYFIVFSVGCTLPNWLGVSKIKEAITSMWRNKIVTLLALIAFVGAVHFFTMAHPFLLADNRHYTFYLWKNLFARWTAFRYAMVPVYLLGGAVMQLCWSSPSSRTLLFQFAYWLVVGLCLVLTPLLEFRYFTTPFLIWALHSAPTLAASPARTATSIALYVAINAATLFLFMHKPFTWPDGSEARFMW